MLLLLAVTTLLTQSPSAQAALVDRLEAAVNQRIVLHSDVDRLKRTVVLRRDLDPFFRSSPLARKGTVTSAEALELLIEEALILDAFPVTDAEVEQQIQQTLARTQTTKSELRKELTSKGFQYEDYVEIIRVALAKRRLAEQEIQAKVYVTDQDIRNYYYNHYPDKASLQYHIHLIQIDPSNYKSSSAAQSFARDLKSRLEAGDSFEDLAKNHSDHPSGPGGGDLGFLGLDEMNKAIADQVKTLQVGNTSAVFGDTKSGYFILRVTDIRSGDDRRLKELYSQIQSELAGREYERQLRLWLERAHNKAHIHHAGVVDGSSS